MKHCMVTIILMVSMGTTQASVADELKIPTKAQKATIQMNEYIFSPAKVEFSIEKPVELTLVNKGTVLHEFITKGLEDINVDVVINGVIVEALGVGELEVPPLGQTILLFTPKKPGEYSFTCEAEKPKNHLREGMAGLLVFK